MPSIAVGIAGAGAFAGFHADKLIREERADFAGVFDIDSKRAHAFAERYSIPARATFDELLDHVDAVIIATPALSHFTLIEHALRRRKHVYVEKPLCDNALSARIALDLAADVGCQVVVGHQERHVLGDLGFFDTPAAANSTYVVQRSSIANGRCQDVSATLDLMIHDLDALCHLFGSRPIVLAAQGRIVNQQIEMASAILQVTNGPDIKITADRTGHSAQRYICAVHDNRLAKFDLANRTVSTVTSNSGTLVASTIETRQSQVSDPLYQCVSAFLDLVKGESSKRASIAAQSLSALHAIEVATEIDRIIMASSRKGATCDSI